MQCIIYTRNGAVLKSNGETINRSIFNNPDIVRADFEHLGNKETFLLTHGKRLIFYKEITMNSPAQTTFCVGYQYTRGKNFKHITKFRPDGKIEVEGNE